MYLTAKSACPALNRPGNECCEGQVMRKLLTKTLRIMKLSALLIFAFCMHVSAKSISQTVTYSGEDIPLVKVFKAIKKQTGFVFFYRTEDLAGSVPVSVNLSNVPLTVALQVVLKSQPVDFDIQGNTVVIVKKKPEAAPFKKDDLLPPGDVKGRIIDDRGEPVIVTVTVKGTTIATSTDKNGEFVLKNIDKNSTLVITATNIETLEVPLNGRSELPLLTVTAKVNKMNDVVIVAYGTTKARNVTTSVTTIKSQEFEQRPVTNLTTVLAGVAPGIQTNAGSGQPGEGPAVRIRGFSSINSDNNPLYVLDGAPYEGVLSNLNMDDIETVTVLKDASATAIYGARGANGVVLITTKSGKRNKNNVMFTLKQGISSRALPNYEKASAYEYMPLMWESMRNGLVDNGATLDAANTQASNELISMLGNNPFNVADNQVVFTDGTMNPNARLKYADDLSWSNAIKRTGQRGDYNLSLSGGNAKTDYFVSLGYLDENGFTIKSDFKRYSARVRVNSQINNWFKAGANLSGVFSQSNQANENSGINENPFYIDLILAPIYPVHLHNAAGDYILDNEGNKQYDMGDYKPVFTGRNVIAETVLNDVSQRRNAINGNANIEIKFLRDFRFTSNVSVNLGNYRSISFDNPEVGDSKGVGRTYRVNSTSTYYNVNQLLNYDKTFGDHSIGFLAGHENYNNSYDYFTGRASGQIAQGSTVLDNFTTVTLLSSYDRDYRTEGYFSRLEYGYKDRYVASGSIRRDGSSKFHPDNKWGTFWSVSGAWNISNEKFFNVKNIDNLRLRASYGKVGNDNLSGYFLYQALYTVGYNNGTEPGILQSSVASPNLVWETTTSSDVAVEFSAFKNRLSGSVEYFRRQSDNLLFDEPLSLTSGLTTRNVNYGSMRNSGYEFRLSGDIVRNKNVKWNLTFNGTTFKNKLVALPEGYRGAINGTKKYEVGKSMYEFWLRDWYGVDPQTGSNLYRAKDGTASTAFVNAKGDSVTTSTTNAMYAYTGSAIPDLYGSVSSTVSYKAFSLQMMLMYQIGGKVFDNDYQSLMYRGTYGRAIHRDQLKRWQKAGDETAVARRATGTSMYDSDQWLTNATYFNLRSVTLTYTVPKLLLGKANMQSARIYLSGENLLITSKRKGLDPTQTYTGAPSYTYAPARIVTLGVNVTL
ncbi:MAG: TonB-dependent receptor [Chitinophagaceae bacterium]